jgi:Flp pilus assembly protein TadB
MIGLAMSMVRRVTRFITPKAWAILAALGLVLILLAYCTTQARQDERAEAKQREVAAYAKQLARAAEANDAAATQRVDDYQTTTQATKERDDDARSQPDGAPDDRELRRRCRQLREAGAQPAACRRFAGRGQAGPD